MTEGRTFRGTVTEEETSGLSGGTTVAIRKEGTETIPKLFGD